MKSYLLKPALFASAMMALTTTSAFSAYTFANTDMALAFYVTGGVGADKHLYFNLGESTVYRDGGGKGIKGNISTSLIAAFGPGWASRADLFVGAAANRTGFENEDSPPVGNQDDGQVFYISKPAAGAGLSSPVPGNISSAALSTAGISRFGSAKNVFPLIDTTLDGAGLLNQTLHAVAWNNRWSTHAPSTGSSFTAFPNIHGNFSGTGDTVLLDIQRIVANTPGTYVATISIADSGIISVIPEPSAALLSGIAAIGLLIRRRRA